MQQLVEKDSPERTLGAMRFSILRLESRPDTRPLASVASTSRQTLWQAAEDHDLAQGKRQAATANITWLDSAMDDLVMGISRRVLEKLNNDRDSPVYRKLFAGPPSEALRSVGGKAQGQLVDTILAEVADDLETYDNIVSLAADLKAQKDTLDAAVAARKSLYTDEGRKHTAMNIALDQAKRDYNANFHHLSLLFPKDNVLVDSFFKRQRRDRGTSEE